MARTDIAPDNGGGTNIVMPYNGIHAIDDIRHEEPRNECKSCDVACAPVPWQGNEDKDSCDERNVREFGVHDGQRGKVKGKQESQTACSLRSFMADAE